MIQGAHKGYIPVKVARSAFGTDDKGSHCPCRGCRSFNLAAGEHEHKLTALWESAFQKLSLTCRHRLTREQWSDLLLEWHRARGHTTYIATLKLVNWKLLPWFLTILADPECRIARAGAAKILEQFDQNPDKAGNGSLTSLP